MLSMSSFPMTVPEKASEALRMRIQWRAQEVRGTRNKWRFYREKSWALNKANPRDRQIGLKMVKALEGFHPRPLGFMSHHHVSPMPDAHLRSSTFP